MALTDKLPVLPFASAAALEQWLGEHHTQFNGVWIKMAKIATGIPSITHDEALEVALCYGWIDGLRRSHDDCYFLQKFTPRRPKSQWSKRNVDKVAMLISEGRMQPAGLAVVVAAKRDGRWEAVYESTKA